MTAPVVVADASVLIPWLHDGVEPYAEPSRALQRDFLAGRVKIMVPRLMYLETANWFVNMGRKKPLDATSLQIFYSMDFGIYDPSPEEHLGIIHLASRERLTTYDACYMHMALDMNIPLWTADEAVIRAWGHRPGGHIKYYRPK